MASNQIKNMILEFQMLTNTDTIYIRKVFHQNLLNIILFVYNCNRLWNLIIDSQICEVVQ